MNIFNSLSNFLYDNDFFFALFKDNIYVYNYHDILLLTEKKIILMLKDFNLHIKGDNLIVKKLDKKEILIEGKINEVKKENE